MTHETASYSDFMIRIEELLRLLLEGRFEDAGDLWQLQLDLMQIQVDLDEEIRKISRRYDLACMDEIAASKRRAPDWQRAAQQAQQAQKDSTEERYQLVHALGKSRSLGDALAWTLFGGNEHNLLPLTENSRVGSVPDADARIGVLLVAQEWAKNGAGFPVLHDITNMLRVGDITFVARGSKPTTVEIKTRHEGGDDQTGTHQYAVQVWGTTREATRWGTVNESPEPKIDSKDPSAWFSRTMRNNRLKRQLERMHDAKLWQDSEAGKMVRVGDADSLVIRWEGHDDQTHWETMRKLAVQAKEDGIATANADDALFYAAVYTENPLHMISKDKLGADWFAPVASALGKSEIWYPAPDAHKNSLWFSTTHTYEEDSVALRHRPLLRYPLDTDSIVDMLWGRLWFFVGLNVGKVVEKLEHHGYRVEYPVNPTTTEGMFMHIWTSMQMSDGTQYPLQLRDSQLYATRMLYEAMSVEGFFG